MTSGSDISVEGIPLEVRLIRLLARRDKEVLPKDISSELDEYLKSHFQCNRYLCIYYNTETQTHLEFNLLPENLHVPLKDPECKTCFRNAENLMNKSELADNYEYCNSARCRPPSMKFSNTEHEPSLLKRIVDRWEDHKDKIITTYDGTHTIANSNDIPFWFDYELFLHHKFDPFKNKRCLPNNAAETNMFSILMQKEGDDFYTKNSIFKGNDGWFDGAGENLFNLSTFNLNNNLSIDFYGCYLIPPGKLEHAKHAAVLLAYVEKYYEDPSEESLKAAKLLGFLSQICWPTLNREIIRDMEEAARIAATAKEREHSHKMLQLLQRPLDALTRAFDTVQSEAQEMQAILNDPEEGLFKTHKLLAPLYQDGRTIQVSEFLTVKPQHEWQYDPNIIDELQRAYCYALCCIFGIEDKLTPAQSQNAFIHLARTALKEVRHKGVFDELIKLVTVVCNINEEIEESVLVNFEEKREDAGRRFTYALQALKRVCFSPFKDFGNKWYDDPLFVAADGARCKDNLNKECKTLHPINTPFAQHAIMSFIVGAKSLLRREMEKKEVEKRRSLLSADWSPFVNAQSFSEKSNDGKEESLKEYRLTIDHDVVTLYEKNRDKGNLQACLEAAVRFGIVGRNVGNFLGIFQDLMRHALGVTYPPANAGSWVLLSLPDSSELTTVDILAVFGKINADITSRPTFTITDCSRYFAIVQERTNESDIGSSLLRLLWTANKEDILIPVNISEELSTAQQLEKQTIEASQSVTTLISGMDTVAFEAHPQQTTQGNNGFYNIIVLDHDTREAWLNSLSGIPYLKGKISHMPENSPIGFPEPTENSVVVLHSNERCSEWESKLSRLKTVIRVVVVSSGGDPMNKGIKSAGKFKICKVKPIDITENTADLPELINYFRKN